MDLGAFEPVARVVLNHIPRRCIYDETITLREEFSIASNFAFHSIGYGYRSNSLAHLIEAIIGLTSNMPSLVLPASMYLLLRLELIMSIRRADEQVVVSLVKGLLIAMIADVAVEVAQVGAGRSLLLYLRVMMAEICSCQV